MGVGATEEVAEGTAEGVVEGAAEEGRNPTLRGKFSLLHHCDVIGLLGHDVIGT